jgi:hypothetical protein
MIKYSLKPSRSFIKEALKIISPRILDLSFQKDGRVKVVVGMWGNDLVDKEIFMLSISDEEIPIPADHNGPKEGIKWYLLNRKTGLNLTRQLCLMNYIPKGHPLFKYCKHNFLFSFFYRKRIAF